jgi:HSP20 family protein
MALPIVARALQPFGRESKTEVMCPMMNRYDPFREALSLRDAMDRLFQESYVRPSGWSGGGGVPMDVHETADGYEVCVSLPGWKPDDVDITVHQNTLQISGKHRADPKSEEGKTWHVRERGFASFNRAFSFPGAVDPNKVEANFEHGELTIKLPKAESAKPRRIQIGGGSQDVMPKPAAQQYEPPKPAPPQPQQPTKEPTVSGGKQR